MKRRSLKGIRSLALGLTLCASVPVWAATNAQVFNYQGRVMKADGSAPLAEPVTMKLGIYDPSGSCLLYEESQAVDLTQTQGVFSIQVGSSPGAGKRTSWTGGTPNSNSMAVVFSNSVIPPLAGIPARVESGCTVNPYVPAAGQARKLRVTVTPQSGSPITLSPDQVIAAAPQATTAETVQGKVPMDFLQITGNSATRSVTDAELLQLMGGAASIGTTAADASSLHHHDSLYAKINYADSKLGSKDLDLTGLTNGQSIRWNSGSSKWEVYSPAAGGSVTNVTAGTGLTGGSISVSGTIGLANSGVTAGTYTRATLAVDATGRVTSAASGAAIDLGTETTGTLSAARLPVASGTASGALNSGDWTAFNSKLDKSGTVNNGNVAVWNGSGQLVDGPAASSLLPKSGGTLTGALDLGANELTTTGTIAAAALKVTGGTLGSGKVLTSDGSGNATWQDPAGVSQWSTYSPNIAFTTGNVGIGTTNPGSRLTVNGLIDATDSGGANRVRVRHDGTHGFVDSNTGMMVLASVGANDVSIQPGYSEAIRIKSGGNVGIGTTAPDSSLYVKGPQQGTLTSYNSEKFALTLEQRYGAGGWGPAMEFRTFDGVSTWTNAAIASKDPVDGTYSGSLSFFTTPGGGANSISGTRTKQTNLVERMRIDQNGFVGIGTTNPTAKLEVNGYGPSVSIKGDSDGAQYSNFVLGNNSNGRLWAFSNRALGSNPYSFMIWNYNGSTFNNVANFRENGDVYLGGNFNEGTWGGTYLNLIGGNVGIGTTSPGAKLEVNGGIKATSLQITGGTPGAGKVLTSDASGNATWGSAGGSGTVTNVTAGTGLTGGSITGAGTIGLADSGVTAGTYTRATVTVDATGRITSAAGGGAIDLSADTTGTLSVAKGGTGLGTLGNNQTLTTNGSGVMTPISAGSSGQVLVQNSTLGAPAFSFIANANIDPAAAIVDTKLATITSPGKVSGDAITSGTIGGSTVINSTGAITTTGTITAAALKVTGGTPGTGKVLTSDASGNATWQAGSGFAPDGTSSLKAGTNALANNTTSQFNVALGDAAAQNMTGNTTTGYNIAVGKDAMLGSGTPGNNTGNYNSAIGYRSLYSLTSGTYNIAAGPSALYYNTTGSLNVAIGAGALQSNVDGGSSVAIGEAAARDMMASGAFAQNIAIGQYALLGTGTTASNGNYNIAMQRFSMRKTTSASHNVSLGYQSLFEITSGGNNIAIGNQAGYGGAVGTALSTGSNNIFLGQNSQTSSSSANNSIAIGQNAAVQGDNAIAIGYGAIAPANTVALGNASTATTLLKGSVGIGTTSPTARLEVNGTTFNNSASALVAKDSMGTSLFSVRNDGWTTIGPANPTAKLTIYDGSSPDLLTLLTDYGPTDPTLKIGNNNRSWKLQVIGSDGSNRFAISDVNASAERMSVTTAGNVGIGTTNPGYKLDVAGTLNAAAILVNGTPISGGSSWSTNGTHIYNSNSGNVGIGTTAPTNALEVVTDGNVAVVAKTASATNGFSTTSSSGGVGSLFIGGSASSYPDLVGFYTSAANGFAILNSGGTQVFKALQNGNVGIGTTNPSTSLDVRASGGTHDPLVSFSSSGASDGNSVKLANGSGDVSLFVVGGANEFAPGTVAGDGGIRGVAGRSLFLGDPVLARMVLTGAGNVGIGTTAPGQKLTVAGTIESTTGGIKFPDGTTQTTAASGSAPSYPTQATLWMDESAVIVGTPFPPNMTSNQLYGYQVDGGLADGDAFEHGFYLKAGTYTLSVLGSMYSARGKLDWYIDGTLVVSGQDWYAGGAVYNTVKTATVTVATDGQHTLRGVVNGKNAASSGYGYAITKIWFHP